jgi:hypothetical protein
VHADEMSSIPMWPQIPPAVVAGRGLLHHSNAAALNLQEPIPQTRASPRERRSCPNRRHKTACGSASNKGCPGSVAEVGDAGGRASWAVPCLSPPAWGLTPEPLFITECVSPVQAKAVCTGRLEKRPFPLCNRPYKLRSGATPGPFGSATSAWA